MRKIKKQMATAAVALVFAATSLLPVDAAGGQITADMSTKIPVIRVAVPTKMAVSVNEFEMGDAGSQVTSGTFTMKNMSETPVNVKVTSTATVGADVTLASTKAAIATSTDSSMWLAAVAAVNDNSGTLEYTTNTDKTVASLAGTEDNVTTFGTKDASNQSKAVQDFYLQAATAQVYKGITGAEVTAEKTSGTAKIGGADFYELEAVTLTSDDAAGVAKAAEENDIYMGAAPVGGTPSTLTKVAKGTATADITFMSGNKAYKLKDDTPTAAGSLDNTKLYIYIDSATTANGDAAAFRYIGKLSESKSGWSSTADLTGITLKYDITAISTATYTKAAGADGSGLTYGYKKAGPSVAFTSAGSITISGLASGQTVTAVTITYTKDGNSSTENLLGNSNMTWTNNNTSGTMKQGWLDYLDGCGNVTLNVSLSGNVNKTATASF